MGPVGPVGVGEGAAREKPSPPLILEVLTIVGRNWLQSDCSLAIVLGSERKSVVLR